MYEMRLLDRKTAKPFVEQYHYTHSMGKASIIFGLFRNDDLLGESLVGVITYGQVSSRDLAQSLFAEGSQQNTWEFLRMVVLDDVDYPRTKFIAQTIKHIKRVFPSIVCLVSFADQTEGHYGYVYQAANWLYCGTTGKKYHYIVEGKRVNKRVAFDRAKALGIKERDFVVREGWQKIEELPKFRYVYPLNRNIRLKQAAMPYPKGNNPKT